MAPGLFRKLWRKDATQVSVELSIYKLSSIERQVICSLWQLGANTRSHTNANLYMYSEIQLPCWWLTHATALPPFVKAIKWQHKCCIHQTFLVSSCKATKLHATIRELGAVYIYTLKTVECTASSIKSPHANCRSLVLNAREMPCCKHQWLVKGSD